MTEGCNVLVACTGSVAALKIPALLRLLLDAIPQVNLRLVTTERALHFFTLQDVPECVDVYRDVQEWSTWTKRGDPVLHIELRRWADLLVIAPCSANSLAKIAGGLCDNLLTCVVRAWDTRKPLIFCPAMNTAMWEHPLTRSHLDLLQQFGYTQLGPISKTLMCGDSGMGAMSEISDIVKAIKSVIDKLQP